MSTAAVVLAAGQGTRMKSSLPKVLHEVGGRPLVSWIVGALEDLSLDEIVVVVGHEGDAVRAVLPDGVQAVEQPKQLGTGDAARVALAATRLDDDDSVLVVPGDVPLLRPETLAALVDEHAARGAAATMLTAELDDPTGYGRVLRRPDGGVVGVVEHADADGEQLAVREVNTSIYVFGAAPLREALGQIGNDNAQGEYYLTDVIGIMAGAGAQLAAAAAADPTEVMGVNSMEQLAGAARLMQGRINAAWMSQGVWMLDPARVYVDADVVLSAGVRIYPGVHLEGATSVAAGAEIGPDAHVRDTHIGEEARVRYAVVEGAEIGARVEVGPYARIRPGTVLGPEAKAGTFVEIKQSTVGARSKVPHLSYIGDAEIGEDSNVGAATITCNYDGYEKHQTVIGDRVKIGSDTMLVAPVEIGDDGWTGAGSVITRDVPPGALGVTRSPQRNVEDYAARRARRASQSED